jgi:uncharacterized membrane protein
VTKKTDTRFWEIDSLRGTAIIMMILFHILYDLNYFNLLHLSLYSGGFLVYVLFTASILLGLVGVSLTLSYNRVKNQLSDKERILKYVWRGSKIFGVGIFVTIATWLYLGDGFVIFGVLHCIGISIILGYFFLRFRYLNLGLGVIIIIFGIILKYQTFDFPWLLWLGFRSSAFYTVDYFPLFPWFGVVLLGIFFGNILYMEYSRRYQLRDLSSNVVVRFLGIIGRHSLIIYLLHQPILFILFSLLFQVNI